MVRSRSYKAMLALVFGVSAAVAAVRSQSAGPPRPRPKLILAIIVDQFRYDYTTRFRDRYRAGLATLLTGGAVFVDAHQDHFPTVTATGHATFMSGSTPATSGIVNNEWYDRSTGKNVTSVQDDATQLVGVEGTRTGSSPHNLIVSSLGDEIKMAGYGASKTIGISMKDRAAILPSGHMADAAYWFDNETENVVSSTYYLQQLPSWVRKFNDERWAHRSLGAKWFAANADQRTAKPLMILPASPGPQFTSKWEETPWANEALERFGEEVLANEHLGSHTGTDLLTVSFSANDHLGHDVGPDDPLIEDMCVRTDLILGNLLAAAERAAGGRQNLIVVFSADHGVAPKPDVMASRKMPGGRLDKKHYLTALNKALCDRFGVGEWIVAGGEGGSFYLDHKLIEQKQLKLVEVQEEGAALARNTEGVQAAYTSATLSGLTAASSELDEMVTRSFFPQRSPDVTVIMRPYYLFGKAGSSHGSPYSYDSHVPLVFWGGDIRPGTYYERTGISDVAPTLSALLQIETPSGSIGHILPQVVSRSFQPSAAQTSNR